MHYIERFGAGTLVRADRARGEAIREATRLAIDDSRVRERAGAVAALTARTSPHIEFPSAIRLLLDSVPQDTAKLTP